MKEIAEMDHEIAQTLKVGQTYWSDEQERFHYFAEQKRLIDDLSLEAVQEQRIKEARGEGRAEGIVTGQREERCAMARKLLKRGWKDAEICDITGLSPKDIVQLRNQAPLPT
ncbi:MAG: hypothetical protein CSA35_01925 [Dethiosulfovibrio peptidovorans]|nr:MAG: hypothetical protein CSA35_01925 [Dethiosulfovibrio peptidovorans]